MGAEQDTAGSEPPPPPGAAAEGAPDARADDDKVVIVSPVADPMDKVVLLGKRSADGHVSPPEDEQAAKLALLSKPEAQTQEETDTKARIKRITDVATDLATARLHKIELAGAAPSCG